MDAQPHLPIEVLDQWIRILGWPTLLGTLAWVIRKWDAGQRQFQEMDANTKSVKATVEVIQNNHLAHLQDGITRVAASNDDAVKVLQQIDTNIKILVDRFPRI
jgi:hypothetical protein